MSKISDGENKGKKNQFKKSVSKEKNSSAETHYREGKNKFFRPGLLTPTI